MDITLPTLPAGMLVLLTFFAPYAVGALNGVLSFVKKPWQKKLVAIVVAVVLAAIVIVGYYLLTGDALTQWPAMVLLAIVLVQASYALVMKDAAHKIEHRTETSALLRRDVR